MGEMKMKRHWARREQALGFVVVNWGRNGKEVVEEERENGKRFFRPLIRNVLRW